MQTVLQLFWNIQPYEINPLVENNKNIFTIPFGTMIIDPSTRFEGVISVNGKVGRDVVLDYSDVGAEKNGNVQILNDQLTPLIESKAATVYVDQQNSSLVESINYKADAQAVTQALTTKADLIGGVIPANQLPSFVDDVLEYANLLSFPATGESGKIYIALDVNKTYRWGGSTYVEIGGGGVALGETEATAYRGDRGKIAYDHAQSQGNPHNTTTSELPEGLNLYFTGTRVRNTPLTGLSIPTSQSDITSTDTILQALGKLQKSISLASSPVWVPAESIGTIGAKFIDATYTKIEVARWGGQLLIRGYFRTNASVTTGDVILTITDINYKTINPSGANTSTANISSYVNATLAFNIKLVSSATIMNSTDAASATQTLQANASAGSGQLMFINNAMVSKLVI